MPDVFRVLHVCTGNIGRSPMAERLMRARLVDQLGSAAAVFVVGSAGTWGHDGSAMEPFAAEALRERGVAPDGFAARELTADLVESADLVLTATVDHRSAVAALVPSAVRRTFTLRELARLAPHVEVAPHPDPVVHARAAVVAAAPARGRVSPGDDDVVDPIGAPLSVYRARAAEVAAAVAAVVDLLAPDRR